ncbi:hypothetical protein CW357_10920 [Rummeliibacillus sp. TYF005]|uniref:hypothetical protein n=1 Tax=Rummeliibacillus sp. TYF005 TaxID=2058214 RepID=UPI000F528F9E|nr:hypothetical protein [Rummeliibacillus sp. TYF005]RPJ95258.1 hypothetical protein CW357_10920 [Rummeliibacillus sp. TYF005]
MKKMMYMIILLAIGIILVACSEKEEKQLTRIDVQKVDNYEDVMVIKDQKKIDSLSNVLENVSWEPKTKADMARREDLVVSLYYTMEDNTSKNYQYSIWFNDKTSIIISNNEKEGFGRLNQKNTQILKEILLK